MARIRSIHPDICIDKGLAEMDDARAERTFMRLWTHCDDDGRCIDDPRLLKAALFPRLDSMTTEAVKEDVDLLEKHGFIVRYSAGGEDYLHVPSFSRWQKPNRKVDSKLPPPPLSEDAVSLLGGLTPVVGEGEVDGVCIAPDGATRTCMHNALLDACSMDPLRITPRELDQVNIAVNQLLSVEAGPEEIPKAASRYREMFDVPLTPMAMVAHWSKLTTNGKPAVDPKSMARSFGANRKRHGVHPSEAEAAEEFESTYSSQPELVAAALDGWRESA